ncbi:MAG: hypothetical protein QM762_05970 [Chryseolinea sp.]
MAILFVLMNLSSCSEDAGEASLTGKGGSLARFAVSSTHLYAVDNDELHVYQFMEGGSIALVNSNLLGPGVETIAAMNDKLYIGTNQAMLVYDLSSPSNPLYLSQYSHFVGCDPVVVQDTLAFVTLRTTSCRPSAVNTLDVVDIKNSQQPTLVSTYALESPYGLGVDGDLLFVCEGENGLKVFDVSNPRNLMLVRNYPDVDAYDVIPRSGILVLTGKNGIVQYDYSDKNNIRQLSTITIQ